MTIHILLVEDEEIVRNGIKNMIEKNRPEITVHLAKNEQEMQAVIEKQTLHLVLLDIQLPEVDGLTILEDLRHNKNNIAVIIISAHAEFHYAQKAIELQVMKYLTKPISKAVLLTTLDNCLAELDLKPLAVHDSIKQALIFIQENYAEPLTLQQMSEIVHLNTSYFSALFKQSVGVNFLQYLTEYRLKQAKALLINTSYSIEEISIRVGYKTAKYFIQIFKDYEKITPNQYRKQLISK